MSPTGVIQRAQQLAAHTFHAQRTWLLVNGSSVGIHASIMAVAGPGDTLLVARNCHKAAFAGLVLSGERARVGAKALICAGCVVRRIRRALVKGAHERAPNAYLSALGRV